MAMKLFDLEVPVHWEIVERDPGGKVTIRLRHKPLAAIKAEGTKGGTTVLLGLSADMAKDLAKDLLGIAEPRPAKLDS